MINVIYEDNHLLVVQKYPGVPVCEDESKDADLLSMLKKYIKEKYNKPGEVYLGLVHRLDRPVGGIMVFARTSKCASRISEQIRNKTFLKTYYAVVEGKIPLNGTFKDKLLKNRNTNITKVSEQGKEAVLDYERVDYKQNVSLVKINLKTGKSHQIRVQFSSRGYPIIHDQKYNKNTKLGNIALFASSLCFEHPITKEKMIFNLELPNKYPWNIFKEEK